MTAGHENTMISFGFGAFWKRIASGHPWLNPRTIRQFRRYVTVGLLSFSLEYGLFLVFYKYCRWWYVWAHTLSLAPVFWVNFILNRRWSFQSRAVVGRQLLLYGLLFCVNLLVTDFLIYLLSGALAIDPRFAKLLVMMIIVLWNFILYQKVIYRN